MKIEEEEYYLLDLLGDGSTSRAFRAVTRSGDECVVKMYIRRYDEDRKEVIRRADFLRQAKAAVEREVQNYHEIYQDLRDHVFWRLLDNDLYCVIHPFFEPLSDGERSNPEAMNEIKSLLETKFAPNNYKFAEEDRRWRHVGKLNEQLYLFDLADLKPLEIREKGYMADHHIKSLGDRLPQSDEQLG
jgi:hypothetical protein